ncbi:ADP-ribose pyrophosphatase [Mycolicibacterium chubuense NBB4]|uniref:8-oxo-dGTP diphosphatase n=1 Tax=Mycolicibacterium chubuense (strain NBB4) TaxID=710421 RepID=I4BN18_MYCCN|nr:NUDIX domain-containing protein [Mycolicibacterium chubuense]AFM18675.1 ADP-ribose pyrophosphatase [Mycolicibacterium chubuense NBB4]
MPVQIVVAGALTSGATLLVAQRDRPAELAGRWELPGGKVTAGESEREALVRELDEELGVTVQVGARLGDDVELPGSVVLRAYVVTQVGDGTAQPHDHRCLRWVTAADLDALDWVPADRAWLPHLRALLADPTAFAAGPIDPARAADEH